MYKEINKFENLKNNEIKNEILWFNNIKSFDDLKKIEDTDFPFSFNETDYFIKRINKAKNFNEKIVIIGDYDCDGVCATSILKIFLDTLKISNSYIIGDRIIDGYGMNNSLIDEAKNQGADLIITVDNGIKCKSEVEYAKSLGIDVIITDHHQPEDDYIPNCFIYNPHYNNDHLVFKDYCGAFVILILIYNYLKSENSLIKSSKELMYELYELASLATIGDLMPLYYFNRKLINLLLKNINSGNIYNLGIKELINYLINNSNVRLPIDTDTLSFRVIPIINAPGRLKNANILIDLFTNPTTDLIEECISLNESRKIQSKLAVSRLKLENTRVNILFDENINEGILGIVASQIKENTNKPTIIMTQTKAGTIKGSGRSIEGFNLLDSVSNIFKSYDLALFYGGHEKALGLTLKNMDAFRDFKRLASNLPYEEQEMIKYYIECKSQPNEIYESIDSLKPYGQNFEKPLFHLSGRPINIKILKEKHSSFQIFNNGIYYNMLLFNGIVNDNIYDFYFYINKEEYNSRINYKCYISDYIEKN